MGGREERKPKTHPHRRRRHINAKLNENGGMRERERENKKKKSQKERKRKKICAHTQHNRGQMLSQTVGSGVREKSSDLSGNRFSVQTLGPQRKKWGRVAAGERPTTATASG
jgi:hypothetical protein